MQKKANNKSPLSRLRKDKGSTGTVSMLILLPITLMLLNTMIDVSIYFFNRSMVKNAIDSSTRLAAIYGGASETAIATQYGKAMTTECLSNPMVQNLVECSLYENLNSQVGTINVLVKDIECGPEKTQTIGERVYCTVEYKYRGLPGSLLSQYGLREDQRISTSAESEVLLR